MNAALKITAAATFAALIAFTAGCSSKAATAPRPDPACRAALAALPARPPVTEKQVVADEYAVDHAANRAATKDTMVRGMTHIVGLALSNLRLDITRGRDLAAARITYNADVEVLKSYCRTLSK